MAVLLGRLTATPHETSDIAPASLAMRSLHPSELRIRSVLRRLAEQRVAAVLQPGEGWVFENPLVPSSEEEAALRTCHMRGWIEPLAKSAIPHIPAHLLNDTTDLSLAQTRVVYRLTEAGWNVIQGTHTWIVRTYLVSLFGVVVGLAALWLAS